MLQEILTIKSDDVPGRSKAYEAIIKGEEIKAVNTPESFNVLVRELKGLGLDVELLKNKDGKYTKVEETSLFNVPTIINKEENQEEKIDVVTKEE